MSILAKCNLKFARFKRYEYTLRTYMFLDILCVENERIILKALK